MGLGLRGRGRTSPVTTPRFNESSGCMERAMGIEPTSEAWEASILPLYDARSGPNPNAEYHRRCVARKNAKRSPCACQLLDFGIIEVRAMKFGDGHLTFANPNGRGFVAVSGGSEPYRVAGVEIGTLQRPS
jgi:hypothetical protein